MKTWMKILLAVLLTLVMLVVTRLNSKGQPENITYQENGYTFTMTTVPKLLEGTSGRIELQVTGAPNSDFNVYFNSQRRGYGGKDIGAPKGLVMMRSDPDNPGTYYTEVEAFERGGRLLYTIEVRGGNGSTRTVFKPENSDAFVLKYIGEVPPYILLPHILFIFATFFCVSLATINAVPLLRGQITDARAMMVCLFWATVFTFLGCYPCGIPMNWYAFGATWEGVPFGTDATDNKTQLLFVYLLFATLAGLGWLTHGKTGRNIFTPSGLGWVGISSFVFLMFIFLIPHSIQFSATLTYAFCYSVIGLIIAVFLIGYYRAIRAEQRPLKG